MATSATGTTHPWTLWIKSIISAKASTSLLTISFSSSSSSRSSSNRAQSSTQFITRFRSFLPVISFSACYLVEGREHQPGLPKEVGDWDAERASWTLFCFGPDTSSERSIGFGPDKTSTGTNEARFEGCPRGFRSHSEEPKEHFRSDRERCRVFTKGPFYLIPHKANWKRRIHN